MSKPKSAKRATLADVEPLLSEMTGASAEELGTIIVEMVAAAKAKAEHEATEMEPPAEEMPAEEKTEAATVHARALLEGFPDEAAQDAFTSEALGALRDIFGQPDADPAAMLDMLKASMAAFKGAIGEAAPPDAAAGMSEPEGAARAALVEVPRLRAEVAKLAAEVARRDTRDDIAKRAADARAALTPAELEQLTADVLSVSDPGARERVIERAIKAAQTVPTGDVIARNASGAPIGRSLVEVAEGLMPEVAAKHPGEPAHLLISRAQRLARERFPHLD